MFWPKLSSSKIKLKVFEALSKNANYRSELILGIPGTYLDTEVFYDDAPFLKDAPFLSTLIANPNHIGCHTLGDEHEEMFSGTQEIEKDVIRICAEEMFKAEPHSYDGYVASGGTEANIQALWVYRNFYIDEFDAKRNEIAVVFSDDSHYSMTKGANLLALDTIQIKVNEVSRALDIHDLEEKITAAVAHGKKYFIVVLNMATTMFGSVDDIKKVADLFNALKLNYKIHADAAYGGFIYPFTNVDNPYTFKNPNLSSISIDAHKMLQAPYGTGIFLVRKNYLKHVCNNDASYVKGKDFTLVGSRSGANAVCIWMILHAHGSVGWTVKMNNLMDKAHSFCESLEELGVEYYRNPYLNIITMRSKYISAELAKEFYLVPDTHDASVEWYKIVLMPHVKPGVLDTFIQRLSVSLQRNSVL